MNHLKHKFTNFCTYIKGGVIEACPPSESTAITVDMTIEPTGVVKMNSCGDQIHAESQFKCYATTVPQVI